MGGAYAGLRSSTSRTGKRSLTLDLDVDLDVDVDGDGDVDEKP